MKKQYNINKSLPRYFAQNGFVTLFFILGISFTFLTWISLSSERVFEYIRIKNQFAENRSILHTNTLCADAFINIMIGSRHNLSLINNSYEFKRNLYFSDDSICNIKSIRTYHENNYIKSVFFIITDYSFEYKFKNGFVNSIKSFNLF